MANRFADNLFFMTDSLFIPFPSNNKANLQDVVRKHEGGLGRGLQPVSDAGQLRAVADQQVQQRQSSAPYWRVPRAVSRGQRLSHLPHLGGGQGIK